MVAITLRTRFIVAFLLIAGIAVGSVGTLLTSQLRSALIADTGRMLQLQAQSDATAIGEAIDAQLVRLRTLALDRGLRAAALRSIEQIPNDAAARVAIGEIDQAWPDLAPNDPIVTSVIRGALADDLRNYAVLDPNNVELMVTDRRGALVVATARTSDYDQSDERWWQEAFQRGTFVSSPVIDQSTDTLGLIIAVTIRDPRTDELVGVVRATYRITPLLDLLNDAGFGDTGHAELLLSRERLRVTADSLIGIGDDEIAAIAAARSRDYALVNLDNEEQFLVTTPINTSLDTSRLGWEVLLHQESDEALEPVNDAVSSGIVIAGVVLLLAFLGALIGAELLAAPIRRITTAAERIAAGDLRQRIGMASGDEIGRLGGSFDRMAAALEQRIAAEQVAQAERLQLQQAMISAQERQIAELDVPAIPLGERMLLLPVIGSVDTRRAEAITRTLLRDVAARRAERVLIDLSGVSALGSAEAHLLMQAVTGVRLLGAETALIGLRPQLALALVRLQVDLSGIPVYANLQSALADVTDNIGSGPA